MTPTTAAVMPVSAEVRAEQDEQEAGHEHHPGGQQRLEDRGQPRVQPTGVTEGTEERDELDHHD